MIIGTTIFERGRKNLRVLERITTKIKFALVALFILASALKVSACPCSIWPSSATPSVLEAT
jgi:hypothetical protein